MKQIHVSLLLKPNLEMNPATLELLATRIQETLSNTPGVVQIASVVDVEDISSEEL